MRQAGDPAGRDRFLAELRRPQIEAVNGSACPNASGDSSACPDATGDRLLWVELIQGERQGKHMPRHVPGRSFYSGTADARLACGVPLQVFCSGTELYSVLCTGGRPALTPGVGSCIQSCLALANRAAVQVRVACTKHTDRICALAKISPSGATHPFQRAEPRDVPV